jgi:hypothetical protein
MVTPVPSIRAVLVPCCVAGAGLGLCGCAREPGARAGERPWFAEITREVGLDFVQRSGARGEYAMPEIMGGGVALLDADGDGDLDVLCVGTNGAFDTTEPDAQARTRFFRTRPAASSTRPMRRASRSPGTAWARPSGTSTTTATRTCTSRASGRTRCS